VWAIGESSLLLSLYSETLAIDRVHGGKGQRHSARERRFLAARCYSRMFKYEGDFGRSLLRILIDETLQLDCRTWSGGLNSGKVSQRTYVAPFSRARKRRRNLEPSFL
jgi:hypothetical protein